MKRIWGLVAGGFSWVTEGLFEFLMSFSEDDDSFDMDWPVSTAKCHLCNGDAPGHHPKGEFVVCDSCQQAKPGV